VNEYTILMQRGAFQFLLVRASDADRLDEKTEGRILDLDRMEIYPWRNFFALTKWGYWKAFVGDEGPILAKIKSARELR
jgi:hypothetical protein